MFEVMSSHSIAQTSGRCLHKQTHTYGTSKGITRETNGVIQKLPPEIYF